MTLAELDRVMVIIYRAMLIPLSIAYIKENERTTPNYHLSITIVTDVAQLKSSNAEVA